MAHEPRTTGNVAGRSPTTTGGARATRSGEGQGKSATVAHRTRGTRSNSSRSTAWCDHRRVVVRFLELPVGRPVRAHALDSLDPTRLPRHEQTRAGATAAETASPDPKPHRPPGAGSRAKSRGGRARHAHSAAPGLSRNSELGAIHATNSRDRQQEAVSRPSASTGRWTSRSTTRSSRPGTEGRHHGVMSGKERLGTAHAVTAPPLRAVAPRCDGGESGGRGHRAERSRGEQGGPLPRAGAATTARLSCSQRRDRPPKPSRADDALGSRARP